MNAFQAQSGAGPDAIVTDVEVLILDSRVEYGTVLDDGEIAGPRHSCLVKVSTDIGLVGCADVDSHPWIIKALVEAQSHIPEFCDGLRGAVVGSSVWDRQAIWDRMYRYSWYHGRRGPALHAMSGIDIALWDLAAQVAQRPVHDLLGGSRRDRVPAYASTLFRDSPKEMRAAARSYAERGFRAIKFGWGSWGRDARRDRELLVAAREEVGPDIALMVDGYIAGGFGAAQRHLDLVADLDLMWAEEPLDADCAGDLARLGRDTRVPIATGEQLGSIHEFRELLRTPGVSIVQPDLSRCGGFTALREIADLATQQRCLLVPHAWTSHLLTAIALQVNAWLPGPVWAEFNVSSSAITRELVTGLSLQDGEVVVPDGPGLGVEVDWRVVDRYRVA